MRAAKLSCALALLASVALHAQAPPAPPEQPVFRSTVDLVPVDVSVVDDRGRPVKDLGVDDFTVTVDGKPRKVVSASLIEAPADTEPAAPEAGASTLDPTFSSNEGVKAGRLIAIVVDQGNIRPTGAKVVLTAAGKFLDRLNRGDRVALGVIPGPGPFVDFTSDHELVRRALGRVVGTQDSLQGRFALGLSEALAGGSNDTMTWNSVVDRECRLQNDPGCAETLMMEAREMVMDARRRASDSFRGILALLEQLKPIDAPKTVVLISEGFLNDQMTVDSSAISAAAAAARVSIYALALAPDPFDMRGRQSPSVYADADMRLDGLGEVVSAARGTVMKVATGGDQAFERMALELSAYYMLSFEPTLEDGDTRPHKVAVTTTRPNVSVRARREFTSPSHDVLNDEQQVAEALRNPFLDTALGLRIATYTMKDAETSKTKLIVMADVTRDATAPDELLVGFALSDERGRVTSSGFERKTLEPLDRSHPSPLRYAASTVVNPGTYLLKLVVIDKDGRRGSVERRFDGRLKKAGDDIELGDLMLSQASSLEGLSSSPDVESNVEGDILGAYLEVYAKDAARLEGASVAMEIAKSETGNAVAVGSVVPAEEPANGLVKLQSAVPLGLLPPGQYVARAIVSLQNKEAARVIRRFRIPDTAPRLTARSPDPVSGQQPMAMPVGAASARVTIPRFTRQDALLPEVVGYFMNRLSEYQPSLSAGVQAAADDAKNGRFSDMEKKLRGERNSLGVAFLSGIALLSAGELERAAAQFRGALTAGSDFFPALFYLGACYAAGGIDREAAGAWQTTLVTETEAPFIYRYLADSLFRLNDFEQAAELLREAADTWPDEGDFARKLAAALSATGRDAEALGTLEQHLQRHADDQEARFLAIRLIYESHIAGRPIEDWQQDLEIFRRFATEYTDADAPQRALVEEWVKYLSVRPQAQPR